MRMKYFLFLGIFPLFLFSSIAGDYRFPPIGIARIDLSGTWKFKTDPKGTGEESGFANPFHDDQSWGEVKVPGEWDNQEVGLEDYDGEVWVRKKIDVPKDWKGFDLTIDLGRVDDAAVCFFNGRKFGESRHIEETNRFTIPADFVKSGKPNVVTVKVIDFGGNLGIHPGPVFIKPVFPWDRIGMTFKSPEGDFIYREKEKPAFSLEIDNVLDGDIHPEIAVLVTDIDGKKIYEDTRKIDIGAGGGKRMEHEPAPFPRGYYNVEMTLRTGEVILKKGISSFVVLGEPVIFRDPERSPFGLSGGALFHIDLEKHETAGDLRLKQMNRLGIRWGRNSMWWDAIYKKRGGFEWEKADSVVSHFKKYGINQLAILNSSTDPLTGRPPVTDKGLEAWAGYVSEMATRYKGTITYWEVWNEPNIPHFWQFPPDPVQYTRLLKITSEAIRKADPDAKIVGGVTSGTDIEFIRKMLENGAGKYMDIVSVHPYQLAAPDEEDSAVQLPRSGELRNLLDKYNPDLGIWYTECGWPTTGGFTEKKQSEYLVKYFIMTLGEGIVDKVYWFNLDDWGPRGSSTGGHWGITFMDHSPKPSFLAFHVMMDLLKDYDSAGSWETGKPAVIGYVFKKDQEEIYVGWSPKGSCIVPSPGKKSLMIDLYGRVSPAPGYVEMTGSPVYFRRSLK